MIGDSHAIQALDSSNKPATGLSWTSSNPSVVSLSNDDPPVLSALAAGTVTISAGGSTATVNVSATSLALGSVIWSNRGNGSGVNQIIPAIPSSTGTADVFAIQSDGTVIAVNADGTQGWTASLNQAGMFLPDFQGGLVIGGGEDAQGSDAWIATLDGATGQAYPAYTPPSGFVQLTAAVHPDGTIFVLYSIGDLNDPNYGEGFVVGIDPISGARNSVSVWAAVL